MHRLEDVPRHSRQVEFEGLFGLGPKELLLKTYSASWQQTLGKLWISTTAVSFSGGAGKRHVVRFCDVREIRSGGFRSVLFVLGDGAVFELSSLWHKEECFSYATSLWWNASRPQRSPGPLRAPVELEDVSLYGNALAGPGTPLGVAAEPRSSTPRSPVNIVGQALDDLDEVADLLLLPAAATFVAPRCDQYGFPLDQLSPRVEEKYNDFMQSYPAEQDKMRRRWLKFLHKRVAEEDIMKRDHREELLTLLLRGLPPDLRPSIYFRISGARKKRSEAEPGYYGVLRDEAARRAADTEWGRAVEKDLLRTYPYHVDFNEDQGALIPALRNVLQAYGLRNSAVGYCLAEDCEILTSDGFLGVDELQKRWDASCGAFSNGLLMGTMNAKTQQMQFQSASRFILNPVGTDAWIYEFENGALFLRVTGEHEMYVQLAGSCGFRKLSAAHLFQMGKLDSGAVCRIMLHALEGVVNVAEPWDASEPAKCLRLASREEFGSFLRLYGFLSVAKEVVFANMEQIGAVEQSWVEYCLSNIGGSLPEWICRLDRDYLREILCGMCLACGSGAVRENSDVFVAWTKCAGVRDNVVRIASLSGYASYFARDSSEAWRVTVARKEAAVVTLRLSSIRRVPYQGRSFCVTVPNGLILARRVSYGKEGLVTAASAPAVVSNCQSMNFVCAALLLIFRDIRNDLEKEEKVFWVMSAIVEDLLPGYYSGDMIGSMVDQSVLAIYCEKKMPRLYAQFKALEYPISLVLCKWMNCLFWLSTPAETAARVMDVTMLLGSDALLEFSLGFLAAFQIVLCQCEDLNEISKLLDSSMVAFFPTPSNVERMQSFIGQLDRRELLTLRHRVFERAEIRLREYSTARTLDRLRNLGSMDEEGLEAMQALWTRMFDCAPHKEGVDRETFCAAVGRSILPDWQREPKLLALLFDHVNKSHSGVVSLNEWANLIESLGSKKGKLRLLYGVCGDKGDPAKVAAALSMLCRCWRGREASAAELSVVEQAETVYTPEKFVRMLKAKYPDILSVLENVKFTPETHK